MLLHIKLRCVHATYFYIIPTCTFSENRAGKAALPPEALNAGLFLYCPHCSLKHLRLLIKV